jgi:hypothetical protein
MSDAPRVSAWCRAVRRRQKVGVRSASPDEPVAEHWMATSIGAVGGLFQSASKLGAGGIHVELQLDFDFGTV